ncbi:MAG: cardiolipin synthase [Thermomicrobiales bacterium]|jgi:phosphatidylserine/phosphatidylglycerophosphate/cardiolipin synthase-like enzyme|nr:cardiolipin synthase [Thermomicrobiales bacterium]
MSRRSRRPTTRRRRTTTSLGGLILVALLILILSWGSDLIDRLSPTPTPTSVPDGSGVVGIFVEPDDGRKPILDELAAARRSVDLQVYLLSDNEIINALIAADRRGVRVRVMLEENPFGGPGNQPAIFARLEDNGVEVRWSPDPYRFAHIKTFVIDDAVAIIMNLNLTKSAFTGNREFAAITTRPAEVAVAEAIFEADWAGSADPPDGDLVVSPSSSRRELLDLIEGAQTSLDIYAEVVRDAEAVVALADAAERGVGVRLIVPNEKDEDLRAVLFRLIDDDVAVRTLPGLYVHAKLIVADERIAFIGSQNFTATSLDKNRELGLLVNDPALLHRLDQTFESDFAAGRPFA